MAPPLRLVCLVGRDRGPYVTLRGSTPGRPSLTPAYKIIEHNFLINVCMP